jgi:hypothetical protein
VYGHLEIHDRDVPNAADVLAYPRVKQVYFVRASTLYKRPVRLANHGITGLSFGFQLSEEQFEGLQLAAEGSTTFLSSVTLPDETVELERVLREVRLRLGQGVFREMLVAAYKGRCAVTRCDAVEALEAAHIDPYSSVASNSAANGILLRADIHTLFDRNLVAIHPDSLTLVIAPKIAKSAYGQLRQSTLAVPESLDSRPDSDALKRRWKKFCEFHEFH